jgi:hypothetical protein
MSHICREDQQHRLLTSTIKVTRLRKVVHSSTDPSVENERHIQCVPLQVLLNPGLCRTGMKRLTSAPGPTASTGLFKQRTPARFRLHNASHTRHLQGIKQESLYSKEDGLLCL